MPPGAPAGLFGKDLDLRRRGKVRRRDNKRKQTLRTSEEQRPGLVLVLDLVLVPGEIPKGFEIGESPGRRKPNAWKLAGCTGTGGIN